MDAIQSMGASTIRVDNTTRMGSAMDTIRMVLGCSSRTANTYLNRLFVTSPELTTRVFRLKINQKGRETPVADAKTQIKIVWLLPGKKEHTFRRQSSEKVCPLLGGNMSVVSEIEARHNSLQSTEEGRATQSFLLDGRQEETIDSFESMPPAFKYVDAKECGDLAKRMIEQQLQENNVALKRKRVDNLIQSYKYLQDISVNLDGRTLIELRDNVTILSRQDMVVNHVFLFATPLLQKSNTPTHELDAAQRGRKTGIVVVSYKFGIRDPQHLCGKLGKLMRQLYIKKCALLGN